MTIRTLFPILRALTLLLVAAVLALPVAAWAGDADALFATGKQAVDQKHYEQAIEPLQQAGTLGHRGAMKLLGGLYYDGNGVKADQAEALRWFLRAANKGDAEAMVGVCRAYADGRGNVVRDYAASALWCRKAAAHGNAEAMFLMGLGYSLGLGEGEGGVAKDPKKAVAWWKKAAAHGDSNAKKALEQAAGAK